MAEPLTAAPADWRSVFGWLSEADGAALQALARGRVVLELGSYLGRSTCCLAEAAEEVVSIDSHAGDAFTGPADTYRGLIDNLDRLGLRAFVRPVLGRIEDVGPDLKPALFDLVYIDSAHDPASVERDARLALRVVKPGGAIAWHDAHCPGVLAGLEAAGMPPPDAIAESLAWCRVA